MPMITGPCFIIFFPRSTRATRLIITKLLLVVISGMKKN